MANHRKKPIDPSKPLPNPKHELIARELAKGSTQISAYKKGYPEASDVTANAIASRTIEDRGINQRALVLLEKAGLSEEKLASSLNECVDDEDKRIKLDATKFGLGMIGYGKEQKEQQALYNPTQINIIIESKPIDNKEDTTND